LQQEVRIMTISRRPSPFGELLSLRQAMDRLFEDSYVRPFGWNGGGGETVGLPVDVSMTADELVVEAQLPGVNPDDVDITVENGTLMIRAETRVERKEGDGDYLVREIRRGTVSRSLTLPNGLEADKATASFDNGSLTLRIPKAEETKPRQIRIKAGNGSTNGTQRTIESSAGKQAG
jgi:HSP20 family protein